MIARLAHSADALAWLRQRVGTGAAGGDLRTDSRGVLPGDAFIAWPGSAVDGRQFVAQALQAGAAACLVEADGLEAFAWPEALQARIAALPGLKAATGPIAAAWHGHPGAHLQVVAVTATNGKTSTSWWTGQALTARGRRTLVVGTLGIGEPPPLHADPAAGGRFQATGLTTPDPVRLQSALAGAREEGFGAVAIEASSIGLAEHRLDGLPIRVAQFINFTRDHLDYHRDMGRYWAAKRRLFDWDGLQAAVVDIDDPMGRVLAEELAARPGLALWTCGRASAQARLLAEGVHHSAAGLGFTIAESGAGGSLQRVAVQTRLVGDHNVHNLLAVVGALRALEVPLAEVPALLAGLGPVPGRLQRVPRALGAGAGPEVLVDYAHTPDALEKALAALQPMTIARGGRLWCVFGCGGNRDATKRPLMGGIARRMADCVVVTSDNPRDEDPQAIVQQIVAGIAPGAALSVIEDRAAAIAHAISRADERDVVLLAGKGHEDYQEVAGVKRPFSDLEQAREALRRRAAA